MKPREITFSWFTLFRVTCFDFPPSHKVFAVAFFLQSLVNLIKRRGDHLQYGDCVISRLRPDTECHFVLIIGLFFVVFRVFFWSIFFVLEDYLSKSNAHLYIIDCVHTNILVHDSQSWEKKTTTTATSKRKRCYVVVGWSFWAFPLRCFIIIHKMHLKFSFIITIWAAATTTVVVILIARFIFGSQKALQQRCGCFNRNALLGNIKETL